MNNEKVRENNMISTDDQPKKKFTRMLNPKEMKERYLESIPELKDIKSLMRFQQDQETLDGALLSVLDSADNLLESLTTSCRTYSPIKALKMRERLTKTMTAFEKSDKVTISLIGTTIIGLMQIQGDIIEMRQRYGGDTSFIYQNCGNLIKKLNGLLKLYK